MVGDSIIGLNLFSYCENNPVNRIDFNGAEWFHWVIAAAVVVVAAVAVVVTAGGAAAAVAAVTCVANGIAATSTAATVAAGAFIGSATAFGVSALVASSESNTLEEFADYGSTALTTTASGLLFGGMNGYSLSRSQNQIQETFDDGSACFIAGTLVHTQYALSPIEEIKTGDLVWAWDESSGEIGLKRVVETYINETQELVHVFVNGEEIITTPTHPFYSPIKGWTSAVKLRAGDILVLLNGEYVVVEKIQHEILETPVRVYNFQVEDLHTYYVANSSVLVHNMCAKKRDIQQVDQAAKQLNMSPEERAEFGDYIEELKHGIPNNKNFTFKELLEIGKQVLEWTDNG